MLDGAVVTRGRGQGTEFDALREYVIGDDVRSIDWRASARRADVVVRTWRPERDRRVVCVLDTGRTSAVRIGDEPRLDAAIDAALLLATLAARAGDRVDLLAVDTAVRAAVVQPRQADAAAGSWSTRWRRCSRRWWRPTSDWSSARCCAASASARWWCCSPRWSRARSARACCRCCPGSPRGTRCVVAAVHDPALDALASTPRRAAPRTCTRPPPRTRALAERDRVRAALTRGTASRWSTRRWRTFASRVADTYLELKATGRL